MNPNGQRVQNVYGKGGRGSLFFKAELRAAEVDSCFEICWKQIQCEQKLTLLYFSSDRFETNRTWALILGLHVLYVSKRLDQKDKRDNFSSHL